MTNRLESSSSSQQYRSLPQHDFPYSNNYAIRFIPYRMDYFRPCNLPPKSEIETENHLRELRELEATYQRRLQRLAGDKALKQMKSSQREFRRTRLNQLWLTRFLPELVNRVSTSEPIGEEIEKAWRQGLPPGIRKVVWPLAVTNYLRITPELFEILSHKAQEIRTLDKLTGDQEKKGKIKKVRVEDLSDSEEECIRSSLSEINKKIKFCNRESSLMSIDMDLGRTFPQLKLFQPADGSLHNTLQKLLESWVCYRPDVGYVQGMSFLAALLLVYLDPFPAFVCFCNLLSSPALLGLYKMDPDLIAKRYKIFDRLFENENPRLYHYLLDIGFPRDVYLLEWFLTLFAKSLSLEMASYVWDLLFLEGEVAVFVAAVAILNLVSERILPKTKNGKCQSSEYRLMNNQYNNNNDDNDDNDDQHQAFDRIRHVLANIRDTVTDEGRLLEMMSNIKSRIPNDILREIKLIGCVEFSAVCCPDNDAA